LFINDGFQVLVLFNRTAMQDEQQQIGNRHLPLMPLVFTKSVELRDGSDQRALNLVHALY
jgi:hypothetical protein